MAQGEGGTSYLISAPIGVMIPRATATNDSDGSVSITYEVALPIPTLSQWGVLILGLLIVNLGVFFVIKHRLI